ncbi:hypothetical protein ABIA35_005351 [Catenulispora sp. MAP12-49]|jgi:hypothetical protein
MANQDPERITILAYENLPDSPTPMRAVAD